MLYILAILIPLTVVLIAIARPGLSFWLGSDFSMHSYRIAQLLLLGTLAFAVGALPFVLLQGLGRPDIPAKLNLLELPFYAAGLYWFIQTYGVTGAAAAWMLRAVADSALLIFFAHRVQTNAFPRSTGAAVESVISL
jgi:O-antigen/teichoic acid export membrane protein